MGVVEYPQGYIVGLFGGIRMLGREGDKGNNHGGINGNGVIQECDNYLLHKENGLWGQQGRLVGVVGVLDFGSVGESFPGMGGILQARNIRVL